jgi:hypothetical protein
MGPSTGALLSFVPRVACPRLAWALPVEKLVQPIRLEVPPAARLLRALHRRIALNERAAASAVAWLTYQLVTSWVASIDSKSVTLISWSPSSLSHEAQTPTPLCTIRMPRARSATRQQ